LRPKHFAAWRINWADKTTNLREIAEELNVGLDSLVFFDNNPRERSWVRSQLPEVAVPELPEDLWKYATVLQNCLYFEGIGQTEEDKKRGRYYAEQRQRNEAKSTMTLEDFYWSLEQKVKIRPMTEETMPRVVQLLQKTNQFNLTTRRFSEGYLRSRREDLAWRAYTLEVTDKYGDSGIVGVAILRFHGGQCHIDDFLLSCRAVGRTIETAFLSRLTKLAFDKGAAIIHSMYIPTARNGIVKDFYAEHGFSYAGDFAPYRKFGEAKGTDWVLLPEKSVPAPPWITYE
jgi:FkbH-like protein